MCGILFGINASQKPEELEKLAKKLSAIQRHRGPDENGFLVQDNVCLAHERLSIVDLEHGRQPISSDEYTVIVNGEIYNHQHLKENVLKQKHNFKTRSDSEIVLHMYKEFGKEMCPLLDGMFAFVVFGKDGSIFIARDGIGIKPLFVGKGKDGSTWFASEIKCLVDICDSIDKFPIGNYWTPEGGYVQWFKPSWIVPDRIPNTPLDLKKIATTFEEAVKKRMMGDVDVGVFLSGGLDSSLVAAMLKKNAKGKVHSFSIGVEGSENEKCDLTYARIVAEQLGTEHHEKIFTIQEGLDAIDKVIYYHETFDAGSIRSGCAMYLLCQLVGKYVKVCISGEGSDEIFAGYLFFKESKSAAELHKETVTRVLNLNSLQLQFNDRLGMAASVEIRVPFLDKDFLELVLNIDPEEKMSANRIEKWILRKAFEGVLPESVLWRQKEHFGDGVGYKWIETLKTHCHNLVSDEEFEKRHELFPFDTPSYKEAFYYRKRYEQMFKTSSISTIKHWMPWASKPELNQSNIDPSPRFHAKHHEGFSEDPTKKN